MNLAVKLYQDEELNPKDIPGCWPSQVQELGTSTTLPEGSGWQLMTLEQYNSYRQSVQDQFDAWQLSYIEPRDVSQNYKVEEFSLSGEPTKTTYFEKKENDEYTLKARDIVYLYEDNIFTGYVDTIYLTDGSIVNTETIKFYTEDNKVISEKE